MKKLKQSETEVIKRSQITLNPYNPKRHSKEQIELQKKNLREIGYLGGVTWNETTGNIVDGHRRVMAMDEYYQYDGTPETDYEIKVEKVNLEENKEKQQMTYMAIANTKVDYSLIADYIEDIDFKSVGISEEEYKSILDLKLDDTFLEAMPTIEADFAPKERKKPVEEIPITELTSEQIQQQHEDKPKMSVAEVKQAKKHCDNVAAKHWEETNSFAVIRFNSKEQRNSFCEILGIVDNDNLVIDGDDIFRVFDA